MKVSRNWLREVTGVDADTARIVAELTMVGIKLEGQEPVGDDVMLDFEITVNRPDCLSVHGLARELCAVFGKPAPALPEIHGSTVLEARLTGNYPAGEKPLRIVLEEPELCPRFCGQLLTGVKVGPSPDWMQRRLEACGVRSINNVVDVTNYVMLELGQPMHAYDYDRLTRATIRVRRSSPSELLVTLDDRERLLDPSMLVIADDAVVVGVGGVMGGKDSEVGDSTTTVLLESAYFEAASIRKTRRALDLSTDASFRFERGADPQMQAVAERRAALLLQQLAGAQVHPLLDVSARSFEPAHVELRYPRIERVLGAKIEPERADRILASLGFVNEGAGRWRVPSFRVDVRREIDLIEEIARHYGYNNFPDTLPEGERKYQPDYASYELERSLSQYLRGAGVDEANAFSFTGPSAPYGVSGEERVRLLNPISEAAGELRTAIVPGLLEAVEFNVRHRNHDVRLFEIGRVFRPKSEEIRMGMVIWGDHLELKGILEGAFPALDYPRPVFQGGGILVDGRRIGWVGHAEVEGHTVQFCEINLEALLEVPKRSRVYEAIIPFPYVERDASLILDESVPYSALEETIRSLGIAELRSYALTDRYKGKNMPAGKVSLTLRFVFQSESRTLLSEEVDVLYEKLVEAFTSAHSAELRKL